MSILDLAAICKRHGIQTDVCGSEIPSTIIARDLEAKVYTEAHTEYDAIVALLKERWGMTTRTGKEFSGLWVAFTEKPDGMVDVLRSGPTELAAVVALADRLAGVAVE